MHPFSLGPGDPVYNSDQNKFTQLFGADLYKNMTPIGYSGGLLKGMSALLGIKNPGRANTPPIREDAWALYLGLPQEHSSFVPSNYKPTKSSEKDVNYFDSDIIKKSLLAKRALASTKVSKNDNITTGVSLSLESGEYAPSIIEEFLKSGKNKMVARSGSKDNVLGNFTLSKGEDERGKYISYYDKWDLQGAGPVGKPFEVYGRIYEDELDNKFPNGGIITNNMPNTELTSPYDLLNLLQTYLQGGPKSSAIDPLRDIEPFRVNPHRGFIAEKGGDVEVDDFAMMAPTSFMRPSTGLVPGGGLMDSVRNQIAMTAFQNMAVGGMAGGLPSIPAAFQLDTINNTPSNVPGGAGGKYDLSQLALQQHNAFVAPKAQAHSDPIFGNKLLEYDNRYQPAAFKKGGKTFFGKIFRGIGNAFTDVVGGIGEGIEAAAPILGILPGVGPIASSALGSVGGTLGKLNDARQAQGKGLFGSGFGNVLGGGLFGVSKNQQNFPGAANPQASFQPNYSTSGAYSPQSLWAMLNQPAPTSGMFNGNFSGPGIFGSFNPFVFSPGFVGQNGGAVGFIPSRFRFPEGGPVMGSVLVPIQTEKVNGQPEMIVHRDGTITQVNATTRHKYMDDDEVTDVVEEGTYITSADKNMTLSYKEAEDMLVGIKFTPYSEMQKGKPPEEVTLASELWKGKSRRDKTFAELTSLVKRKFPTVDKSDYFEGGNDIFTQMTNKANIESRYPYLTHIIGANEEKRPNDGVGLYQKGGPVVKAQFGEAISQIMQFAPLISSLLGAGQGQNQTQGPGGISPLVQAGLLGTIAQYQGGVNRNIGAQSSVLGSQIGDFSSLGNQLIADAAQSASIQTQANRANTLFGLTNALSKETNLPRLSTLAQQSRIQNARPRGASRASVEALSTPNFDANAIMSQLGARSGPVIAQLYSDNLRNRNQLTEERNRYLDSFEQNQINQLNALDTNRDLYNIGQTEKERLLREQGRDQYYGTLQQGTQRGADIQSGFLGQRGNIQGNFLSILADLQTRQAQLVGQEDMLGAQNAFNAFSTLGAIQSQNATAMGLNGQSAGAPGTGAFDSFGNFNRYMNALNSGGRQINPLSPIPTTSPGALSSPVPQVSSNLGANQAAIAACQSRGGTWDYNTKTCVQ